MWAYVVLYNVMKVLTIRVETSGGMLAGLSFKPGLIEGVSVDVPQALAAINIISEQLGAH